ncbi:asparaginase domain-containing protein [Arhodomonas sp. AD133]|uniref:asparaginase domain-containing protein n=1 Tax=Arhodomonas sp. AD133 TaxID=3415009 RepID=UPI003EB6F5F7
MPRLLIVHAGGTIGMVPSANGYVPTAGFPERLQRQLQAHAADRLPGYRLIELAPLIDSADLVPDDWNRIVGCLATHWHDYDGFIVLHGTDTLAHTAAALSFMLGPIDKPVVFTGAQIPLDEPRSDGLNNLVTAMFVAASPAAPAEVSVCFHGRLLRGNRARKVRSQGLDAFDSPNAPWLGEAGIELTFDSARALAPGKPMLAPLRFDSGAVAVVQAHPGLSPRLVAAVLEDPAVRGVVLQTYGVGNPPGMDGTLLARFESATAAGLAIVNVTQCLQGRVHQGAYASGAVLNDVGVVSGRDMTPEAAVTKLQVLIARQLQGESLRHALGEPLRGELTPV